MSYNLTLIHCPTEKAITEANLIPWIPELSRPIYCRALQFPSKYHVYLDSRRPKFGGTFLTVWVKGSCVFRFMLAANSIIHGLQSRDGGLILC